MEVTILSFNKNEFKKKLNQGDYSYCIYILHQEIKSLLIEHVKKYDKDFSYTDLKDLKNKCIEYLEYDMKTDAIEFYDLSMNQETESYELDRLLDIYSTFEL
jgi:hypothetical protein